jgi:hypothetical protein
VRVFISWSKEPSRTIARELSGWLEDLVDVEAWMSDEEIASGRRWRDEIGSALNETDFGIICLTRGNQHEPWLMFEAGALAKNLIFSRVIPLYIDLQPKDVKGPLEDFRGGGSTKKAFGGSCRTSTLRLRGRKRRTVWRSSSSSHGRTLKGW